MRWPSLSIVLLNEIPLSILQASYFLISLSPPPLYYTHSFTEIYLGIVLMSFFHPFVLFVHLYKVFLEYLCCIFNNPCNHYLLPFVAWLYFCAYGCNVGGRIHPSYFHLNRHLFYVWLPCHNVGPCFWSMFFAKHDLLQKIGIYNICTRESA